jgi:RNA polymerase sigma factor CnrH
MTAAADERELPPELTAGLPRRDPDALARFFELYFDRVHAYVRGLVRHEQAAEDLTQDIFLRIHRAFETYDPARPLRPWVFSIAVNRVRDYWRTRAHQAGQRDVSLDVESPDELGMVAEDAAPELPLERLEDAERVRAVVASLPDGLREVVVLRVFEEMGFEEIAAALGSNAVAVRKRYSRALAAMRDRLGARGATT